MTYIEELRDMIRKLHDVESKHVKSVPDKEVFQGKAVWQGIVEVLRGSSESAAPLCVDTRH